MCVSAYRLSSRVFRLQSFPKLSLPKPRGFVPPPPPPTRVTQDAPLPFSNYQPAPQFAQQRPKLRKFCGHRPATGGLFFCDAE